MCSELRAKTKNYCPICFKMAPVSLTLLLKLKTKPELGEIFRVSIMNSFAYVCI